MSIAIMTRVWKEAPVAGSDLLVLLALADSAGDDDLECYPSIAHLAQKSRLSEKQVGRVLKHLKDLELIEVKKNGAEGRGRVRAGHVPNLYRICPENWQATESLLSSEGTSVRGDTQDPRTTPAHVPPTGDTQDPQNHHSEPSLETLVPQRKVKTTKQEKHELIDAWYTAMGYEAFDIGIFRYIDARMKAAARMLAWPKPVTCAEISDYCAGRRDKTPDYDFCWLEKDLANARLFAQVHTAKPQKTLLEIMGITEVIR